MQQIPFFFQERTSADVKRPRGEGSTIKAENLVEAMRDFINTVNCKEESPVKDEILDVKIESGMENRVPIQRHALCMAEFPCRPVESRI